MKTAMKQYRVDELRSEDLETLKAYLDDHLGKTALEGTYWLEIPPGLLGDTQAAHVQCQPHVVACEVDTHGITCEFLVRTRKKLHCDCMEMANAAQRVWIMEVMDGILEKLSIPG